MDCAASAGFEGESCGATIGEGVVKRGGVDDGEGLAKEVVGSEH